MTTGGCPPGRGEVVRAHYDFADGDLGWKALFSDFAPDMTESMELEAGVRHLPPELGRPETGYYIQSHNRSDDVFMLLYRHLGVRDGVSPGATYIVRFRITMASDAPAGCSGIGGAPAEAVTLKVGAAHHEPRVVIDDRTGLFRVTIDKGNQAEGGKEMSVAGDIANGADPSQCNAHRFRTFTRTHQHPTPVTATATGDLWLLVGTDSGYEGLTRLYYERIDVELERTR
ncbi:MAG TPA: hypothetical protein VHW23_19310 [Kofleriaceae bacterium]|nr:hypothetical protein [Kofleriaceae bacterium]